DFFAGDLTKDGAWHDLDLSGIIPAGTKRVMLRVQIIALATIGVMKVKTKGNAQDVNVDIASMETNGFPENTTLLVVPDADGIIEYWMSNVTYLTVIVTVAGWTV
ncbi:hypothetical protein LCGC14_1614660, partial [marine sediment metagenome]